MTTCPNCKELTDKPDGHKSAFGSVDRYTCEPLSELMLGMLVDMVNHPPHYTSGRIEVIDFILDQKFNYLDGQVIKYVSRARHKGSELEDLKKAEFYLKRRIKELEQETTKEGS